MLGVYAEPLRANSYCVGGVDIREERVKIGLEDAQCMGGRRSPFTVLPPSLGVTPSRGGVVKNVRAGKTDSLNCMCSRLSRVRNMFQWLSMFGAHAKP